MTPDRRRHRVAAVAVALLAAGCGGSSQPVVSSATTAPGPTGPTATTAAVTPDACQPRGARPGERSVEAGEAITAIVPDGWEVRSSPPGPIGSGPAPYLHAGNFALPDTSGTGFGGAATDTMGGAEVFVALVEQGADRAGSALYATEGLPCPPPTCYRPEVGNPPRPGQGGCQAFFSVAGRPFTMLAVVGSHERRAELVPLVNDFLAGLTIAARR